MTSDIEDVLNFWFVETEPRNWWIKNDDFDTEITDRFLNTYEAAASGALDHWAESPRGILALIIVLDQFSRNMFRDTPKSFATDDQALGLARCAVDQGFDQRLDLPFRSFVYMPFEHSEDLADQQRAVELMQATGNDQMAEYAVKHMEVIQKYGRFPHRNKILGRESTAEEEAYLAAGGGF